MNRTIERQQGQTFKRISLEGGDMVLASKYFNCIVRFGLLVKQNKKIKEVAIGLFFFYYFLTLYGLKDNRNQNIMHFKQTIRD